LHVNGNRFDDNRNSFAFGIALATKIFSLRFNIMKTYKSFYTQIYSMGNLILAWRHARKGKTKKNYVIQFEKSLIENLFLLYKELKNEIYFPMPLKTFILRDPKTRKVSYFIL
jgi:hypothetical protein